jgi:hypothetical protein
MAQTAKVPVKSGDTLSGIAKANGTTVDAILADPRNATIAARVEAGQTAIFNGSSVAIPAKTPAATAAVPAGTVNTNTASGVAAASGTGTTVTTPDPNAPKMFTGPIPVDSTRTATGYIDSSGTAVNPTAPYTYDPVSGEFKPTAGTAATGRTVVSTTANGDGTFTVTYSDGTTEITGTKTSTTKTVTRMVSNGDGTFTTFYSDGTSEITGTKSQAGLTTDQINKMMADNNAALLKQLQDQQNQAKIDATNAQRKSAFEITKERFAQAGMAELGQEIVNIYQGTGVDRFGKAFDEIPTSAEGFYLALINTKSYYDRFGKVNEARLANGFKALDEKTIVGMEDEYQKTMQAYNAPAGFYDQTADFQTFLKNNYNVTDVANTMQAYSDFTKSTDAGIRGQLKDLYGIDDAALTAYFADPTKGQPILESIAGKNMNTAAALLEGLTKEQAGIGQQYGAGNLTYGQQRQAYSKVQKDLQTTGALAQIYGESYGAQEAISAEFGGDVAAQMKAARIQATGAAAFGGTSAIGRSALGTKTTGLI